MLVLMLEISRQLITEWDFDGRFLTRQPHKYRNRFNLASGFWANILPECLGGRVDEVLPDGEDS
jgi:hypothetical protein